MPKPPPQPCRSSPPLAMPKPPPPQPRRSSSPPAMLIAEAPLPQKGDRHGDGRQVDGRQGERWETGRKKDRETGDVVRGNKEDPQPLKCWEFLTFFPRITWYSVALWFFAFMLMTWWRVNVNCYAGAQLWRGETFWGSGSCSMHQKFSYLTFLHRKTFRF